MKQHARFIEKIIIILLIASSYFLFPGCAAENGGTEVGNPVIEEGESIFSIPNTMSTFKSINEIETYLKEQHATNVSGYSYRYEDEIPMEEPASSGGDTSTPTDAAEANGSYTGTNNQEKGVDESDHVKIHYPYLYIAGDKRVVVVKTDPNQGLMTESTIKINGTIDSLHLDIENNILCIFYIPPYGSGHNIAYDHIGPADAGFLCYTYVQSRTGVMILDIKTPATPLIIKHMVIDGRLISSRLIEGKLHVIQQYYPELPILKSYYDATTEKKEAVIAENRESLESVTIDDLLPSFEIYDNGSVVKQDQLVTPERFYYPDSPGGGSVSTVTTFDFNDPLIPFQSTGIIANTHTLYASSKSLYLVATQYSSLPHETEEIHYNYKTVIHKFDLREDVVIWLSTGSVIGNILNQFSLGEFNDVLRIATTTGQTWGTRPTSKSHVFCLEDHSNRLEIVGKLTGLAPGERIYAARFIGNRGFLVTFVQIDPLFTIDLSDPTAPRVVGELKVPGYSDYIHPIDENHLLTIGKSATTIGSTTTIQGIQLSIFDVSDFSNPKQVCKELLGDRGTNSEALHNHKAFTFWSEKGLLAFPVDLYEYSSISHQQPWDKVIPTFKGIYIYRILEENNFKFELLGRISTTPNDPSLESYYKWWLRGIFINDMVYAVQDDIIYSAEIEDIENTVEKFPF